MKKNEINELITIYEEQGFVELLAKLYELKQQYNDIQLDGLIVAYMHQTNGKNNSYFYTSNKEQFVTNNTSSIIYFNKKIFDFKNINNRKIVTKKSFEVNKEAMLEMLKLLKAMSGNNFIKHNNTAISNDELIVFNKENYAAFSKKEFDIISEMLNKPEIKLSADTPYLYIEGENGYAYIKGKKKIK